MHCSQRSDPLLVFFTVTNHPDYGDVADRSASKCLLHKLDVIYHTVTRLVTGASFSTHRSCLYSVLNWPSLKQTHWFLLEKAHYIYSHFSIFTTQTAVCVLVASSVSSYPNPVPPLVTPPFSFLLQIIGIICSRP